MRFKFFSWANQIFIEAQAYKPSKWERVLMPAFSLLLFSTHAVFAAGGATAALNNVATTVIGIVNVLFIIGLAIGLGRTVWKFFQNAPDALSSLGWLVGGVILWYAFQLFKDELASAIGGSGGITR